MDNSSAYLTRFTQQFSTKLKQNEELEIREKLYLLKNNGHKKKGPVQKYVSTIKLNTLRH